MRPSHFAPALAILLWSATACSEKKPDAGAPPAAEPEAGLKKAGELYQARCAACHGPKGAGDGPAAGAFQVKARSFREPAWQAEVADAYLEKVIVEGGVAVGKSPAMPAAPDLARDARLADLVRLLRAMGDPPAAK